MIRIAGLGLMIVCLVPFTLVALLEGRIRLKDPSNRIGSHTYNNLRKPFWSISTGHEAVSPSSSSATSLQQKQNRPKSQPVDVVFTNQRPKIPLDDNSTIVQKLGLVYEQQQQRYAKDRYNPRAKRPTKYNPPTKLPKPIIVVGLPKAGTSSLFSFFYCNGLPSQHWYCCNMQQSPSVQLTFGKNQLDFMAHCMMRNLISNRTILQSCGSYQALTELNGPRPLRTHIKNNGSTILVDGVLTDAGTWDTSPPYQRIFLPQHFALHQIHSHNPNATWILNQRPVDGWVQSVLRWTGSWNEDETYREVGLAEQLANEYHFQYGLPIPQTTEQYRIFLTELYQNHTKTILDFVRRHPSHALVDIDVTHPETGEILADAFGLDASCWKNMNQNMERLIEEAAAASNTTGLGSFRRIKPNFTLSDHDLEQREALFALAKQKWAKMLAETNDTAV